jgi:hypothetical protein
VVHPKAKTRPQGTSEIELALAKPIAMSKKFCLLNIMAPSHGVRSAGLVVACADECVAQVTAFDNLGDDSSLDARRTPSLKRAMEKCVTPLPSMSG